MATPSRGDPSGVVPQGQFLPELQQVLDEEGVRVDLAANTVYFQEFLFTMPT